MKNQILDEFLSKRSSKVMESIQKKIYKEVREGICDYFGTDDIMELNEDQIDQVIIAQETRDRGFLKLGYSLVLKQLRNDSKG